MARKTLLLLCGLVLLASLAAAATNPWGNLKKIYFYEANDDAGEVRKNLERLDTQGLPPEEKTDLVRKLSDLGDRYFQKGNDPLAEAFFRKALGISPQDAWPLYNQLEKISRRRGGLLWDLGDVWRQFRLVLRGFSSSFLLLDSLISVLMFSGLLAFYLVAAALSIRYFKLAAHDFILGSRSRFLVPRLLLLLLLLLWPLAITGGWGFYPFLVCGFLWNYLNHDERTNVKRLQVVLLGLAFLYSIGQYLETSMRSPGFQTVKEIYSGRLFPESAYSRFDNGLKVMQAYAYYHQNRPDAAMDVLLATGNTYSSVLKSNLLGNIYFEKGDIPQSIHFYRKSLSLDNRDQTTLKNFTVALLKNNDPELFRMYSRSYPEIQEFKDKVTALQKARLPEGILWSRLLNYSWENFHFWNFLSVVLLAFIQFPVLPALLVLALYAAMLPKFFPALGQSIFCSKCGKIIKRMSIEQAPSHALCDGCYQLFLIKDPIFLEAKILKERDINRQFRIKNFLLIAASLLIPGFLLNFRNRGRAFSLLFLLFFTVFGLFLFAALNFKGTFGVFPMFLNLLGIAAVLIYLAVSLYSIKGEHDGF
jgi:tetratricopeptide (TPR) repeat protein